MTEKNINPLPANGRGIFVATHYSFVFIRIQEAAAAMPVRPMEMLL